MSDNTAVALVPAPTEKKKLYLGVNEDSQLGKLLLQLAQNPLTKTDSVCKQWTQNKKGGGKSLLSPTRGSFLLDTLAEATEGKDTAHRPRKGLVMLAGIKGALRTDEPKYAPVVTIENVKNIAAAAVNVETKATNGVPTLPENSPAMGEDSGEVPVIFPDRPVATPKMASFQKPAWYTRLDAALAAGKHVSIAGPPGIGKSTAPEQWCAENSKPLVVVNGDGGLRRHHLEGTIEMSNGSTRFVAAEVAAAAINGWICIINEVNAADPDALLWLNGLMEVPFRVNVHGRSYPVHPEFRLIVTYNPGLVGTKPLPQAFKDRFFPIKVDFPDAKALRALLTVKGLPKNAPYADALVNFAVECNNLQKKNSLRYQISPRRLFDAIFLIETAKMGAKDAVRAAVIDAVDTATDVEILERVLNEKVPNHFAASTQGAAAKGTTYDDLNKKAVFGNTGYGKNY